MKTVGLGKSATWEKSNTKKVQHKKSATQEKWTLEISKYDVTE